MDTEDFSFPTISDTHSYAIDSPPLWNLSPVGSPNPYQACSEGKREKKRDIKEESFEAKFTTHGQRRSFSYIENKRNRFGEDDDEEEEEGRMDMLWEDFNEELWSTTGSATSSSREVTELTYASTLKVANKTNNGGLISNKSRPGMVMLVKVMKKLFSLSNSQWKPRKRVC